MKLKILQSDGTVLEYDDCSVSNDDDCLILNVGKPKVYRVWIEGNSFLELNVRFTSLTAARRLAKSLNDRFHTDAFKIVEEV